MSAEVINSESYWDQRFSTDWEVADGRSQSRYFAAVAHALMPGWLLHASRTQKLQWCDWGCALGDGTDHMGKLFAGIALTGIDFSHVAIEQAQARYPHLDFVAEDWVDQDAAPGKSFDVVFSSNTLEHFHQPWEVVTKVAAHATRAVAMLVPYQEAHPIEEHYASFWPDNVPTTLPDGKLLVHMSARDVAHDQPAFWPGQQVLMVWVEPLWFAGLGIAADQLTVDVRVPSTLVDMTVSIRSLALQLDMGLARLLELRSDGADRVRELRDELQRWLLLHNQQAGTSTLDWTVPGQIAEGAHLRQLHAALDAMAPVLAESEAVAAKQAQLVGFSDEVVALRQQLSDAAVRHHALVQELEDCQLQHREHCVLSQVQVEELAQRLEHTSQQLLEFSDARIRGEAQIEQINLQLAQMVASSTHYQQLASQLQHERNQLVSSLSWRMTRPLRVLRRILNHPGAQVRSVLDWLERRGGASARLSRKLRSGARFIKRSVRNGRIDPADQARLNTVFQQGRAAAMDKVGITPNAGPEIAPATEKEDVFVWSVIDWHFRMQRPQHLAAALARSGHRVFYISNNFVDSGIPGFHAEALDASGRLFQVNLNLETAPQIYSQLPTQAQQDQLQGSLARLLGWTASKKSFSIVQHPYWEQLSRCVPSAKLVYDCMDHHAGFADNVDEVLAAEQRLVSEADLLVVTSGWLVDELAPKARNSVVIRNATEYTHFCTRPDKVFKDAQGRKVIGYYGAIAEWFDPALVRDLAIAHPDALVLLIGRDTAGVGEQLKDLPNVRLEGEVPYDQLPYWLHGFDVCLLPFQVIPLTLATNPVKVYEYLSAGKPVVSVDLPEMQQFSGLVSVASTAAGFVAATTALLASTDDAQAIAARREFAACQTWNHRAADLEMALASIQEPRVSVIVLTYNNLELTKACLQSIEQNSDYSNLEVIAVDNASSDGSQDYLAQWESMGPGRRFIANAQNLGFSAGNNVGLAAATGEYLVILNNDTYVTAGWVRSLVNHLRRHPSAGLVGPVTNNIGNEARIEIAYGNMDQMQELAGEYTRRHAGVSFSIRTAAFFCVMLSRRAYEAVGPMDEQFGVGFFEDDDYCMRLHAAGFDVRCAEDVFVHHHLSASFNKLKAETKQALFDRNRALYEQKWGTWTPHAYRTEPAE
jgi:GT2 family glycosyltransferase/glycosyltransferase involved in cell wall biosynthesis